MRDRAGNRRLVRIPGTEVTKSDNVKRLARGEHPARVTLRQLSEEYERKEPNREGQDLRTRHITRLLLEAQLRWTLPMHAAF